MQYYTTLTLAVSKAVETVNIDLENLYITAKTHLMAQRRSDGAWHVRISDAFDSNMTNISDLPIDINGSQKHIVELIAGCWQDDWDE
jgi:hypothetical protein